MNIVIDTNIFIAALIKKEGLIREIIINSDNNFIFPEYEFQEIYKYKEEILKKSGYSESEFIGAISLLSKNPCVLPHTKVCGLSGIFGDRKLEVALSSYRNVEEPEILISGQLPQHKCCGLRQFSILNHMRIASYEEIYDYYNLAFEIIGKIDFGDIIFIATALAFNAIIWSDDKHFKMQEKIKILNTKEMENYQN